MRQHKCQDQTNYLDKCEILLGRVSVAPRHHSPLERALSPARATRGTHLDRP